MFLAAWLLVCTPVGVIASCPISFDGRIPRAASESLFSSPQSPFNPKYVIGQNLSWDEIIMFPDSPPSRFDEPVGAKPVEVTLSDASIFASSSEGAETALRRAELLVNNLNTTVSGIKNWHLSIRSSPERPLDYRHEYVIAFHEAQDFQADFWSLKTGTPMHPTNETDNEWKNGRRELYLQGYKWEIPVRTFFSTPFTENEWHNFGLQLDYGHNKMQVFYSKHTRPLQPVTPVISTNLSGKAPTTLGETHFGLQKRPRGANLTNFLYEGVQESGISEGIILGGIWQEDSELNRCITL